MFLNLLATLTLFISLALYFKPLLATADNTLKNQIINLIMATASA